MQFFFGSVGGPVSEINNPKWKDCEKNALLGLRKAFNFNINMRPARIYPALKNLCPLRPEILEPKVDLLMFRELLGGIYFGQHQTIIKDGQRFASDVCEYTESAIAAIAHPAFKAAQLRSKRLVSVDKANVLDTSRLWRAVVDEVAKNYPDVQYEHMLVDNCAMQLIRKPTYFDVILTENMFGDILSDAAAVLPGSLGLTPSASLNAEGFGMYEPSGGSAQDIAGKGIANPIAQVLSLGLMCRYSFGMNEVADAVERAVERALDEGARCGDIAVGGDEVVGTERMVKKIVGLV
jgi:3-isopropylmalate dehydrogenase